jgi:leader peptidase (prepilin peptidase)/N-methyltransferase
MNALPDLFVFFLGLIVGSFLNVVVYRYNTGLSMVNDRSKCMSCARQLSWYDMIPVFSYLGQGGRCRTCLSNVSIQYPLVELATGAVFVFLFRAGVTPLGALFSLIVFSILLVIAVYDMRHTIIPDGLVFSFITLAFLSLVWRTGSTFWLDALSGIAIALFFAALWYFSGGKWMGFGDAKLALGIGWLLPFPFNVNAIIFAFWIGAAVGILLIYLPKLFAGIRHGFGSTRAQMLTMKSEIPFAPFLILGTFLAHICQIHLW